MSTSAMEEEIRVRTQSSVGSVATVSHEGFKGMLFHVIIMFTLHFFCNFITTFVFMLTRYTLTWNFV